MNGEYFAGVSPLGGFAGGEVFVIEGPEDLACLLTHAYRIHRWDAATWKSDADAHDALARELRFPDYFRQRGRTCRFRSLNYADVAAQ
jgi:hypothetical protein